MSINRKAPLVVSGVFSVDAESAPGTNSASINREILVAPLVTKEGNSVDAESAPGIDSLGINRGVIVNPKRARRSVKYQKRRDEARQGEIILAEVKNSNGLTQESGLTPGTASINTRDHGELRIIEAQVEASIRSEILQATTFESERGESESCEDLLAKFSSVYVD